MTIDISIDIIFLTIDISIDYYHTRSKETMTTANETTSKKKTDKTLTAYAEHGVFTRQDGVQVAYTAFYVDVMGIRVRIVANDNTGKQVLEAYFNN